MENTAFVPQIQLGQRWTRKRQGTEWRECGYKILPPASHEPFEVTYQVRSIGPICLEKDSQSFSITFFNNTPFELSFRIGPRRRY